MNAIADTLRTCGSNGNSSLVAQPVAHAIVAGFFYALLLSSIAACGLARASSLASADFDGNLVPNAALRGNFGTIASNPGDVTGNVPTLWRASAYQGATINLERIHLGANDLFPGSPPTEALKISVPTFGTNSNQNVDSSLGFFSVRTGMVYGAQVYVRSGNADNSSQSFDLGLLFYDSTPAFNGHFAALTAIGAGTATAGWTKVATPQLTAVDGDHYAKLRFNLIDNGGENSIIIALPTVEGPPVYNIVPNPGFIGSGGLMEQGNVSGTVPDSWRAFAVGTGSLNVTTVPVAANELYPGSLPTNAVRLAVTGGDAAHEGFDHELIRAALHDDDFYRGEMYVRSGNAGGSAQGVTVAMPIFDATGTFTGMQPGSFTTSVGPEWSFLATPQFRAMAGDTTDMAFRLAADGGDDIILIAAPRIVDPSGWMIFMNGFE